MSSCFVAFLCFVMDALRIGGPPWDTIRWTVWEGTVLWACFPQARCCITVDSTSSNMNQESNISLMSDLLGTRHPPLLLPSLSCSHCLCPYFYLLLFYCCLALFFFMIYGRTPLPLLLLTPESNAMDVTSCSSQGLDKTTSNMVSLTNVFYLSTINNVAVKHVRRATPYIQSHLLAWDCKAALWTWHS